MGFIENIRKARAAKRAADESRGKSSAMPTRSRHRRYGKKAHR